MRFDCSISVRPNAFTLLEAIVVIVLVGVLAGLIAPRMINVGQRQAELEAKSVQRLLSIAGERALVAKSPVAIDYSESAGPDQPARLSIWTRREDAKANADTTGSARVKWEEDRLIEPVTLVRLRLTSATEDGAPLTNTKWRITMAPGQPHPVISIRLEPVVARDGPPWLVTLQPEDIAAALTTADGSAAAVPTLQPRSIDLDDAGKGTSKW